MNQRFNLLIACFFFICFFSTIETLSSEHIYHESESLLCTGTIVSSAGVPDATNAEGIQNATYASLHETNDEIILDLGEALSATTDVDIIWRRTSGSVSEIAVETSSAPASGFSAVSGSPFTITTQNVVLTETVSVPAGDRYMRIVSNNGFDLGVDAISFTCPTGGGGGAPTGNFTCSAGASEITGTVFEDFDYDGLYDSGEYLGVKGIPVQAIDSLDNSFSAVTNASGNYTISGLTGGRTYRVEFTFPDSLAWAKSTFYGGDNGTTVQFLQPGNCANLGVANPADYCEDNPFLMLPCYVDGDNTGTEDVIVRWSYNNSGLIPGNKTKISDASQVAALWGMTYNREQKMAYGSAILKTHIGLHDGVSGGGLDAIFSIDPFNPTNGTLWLELQDDLGINVGQSLVPNNTTRQLANTTQHDEVVYPLVGTVGIGDIEISTDNKSLYVMNLYNKKLYQIDIASKMAVDSFAIPDPGCTNGNYRPWAVEYYKGEVYVGSICDASSAGKDATASDALTNTTGRSDLHAYVYRLEGSSFVEVLDFVLDYEKQPAHGTWGNHMLVDGWFPWTNDIPLAATSFTSARIFRNFHSYPQPILSDIVFDTDGSMVLGFMDRMALQLGDNNYGPNTSSTDWHSVFSGGDLLRACKNGNSWLIEGTANSCTNSGGHALGSGTGIYSNAVGEYYEGDFFDKDDPGTSAVPPFDHPETTIGSMILLAGKGEVITTVYDPVSGDTYFRRGGVLKLDNQSGDYIDGYQVYDESEIFLGKGIGLGDLIAVCDPAPIEIGNFVWIDADSDGIQDAGETGIEGIRMELYDAAGNLLAFDSTDALGYYFFSGNGIDDAAWQTADDTLTANTDYYIVAGGNGQYSNGLTVNSITYELTSDSLGSSANRYAIDSDGTIAVGIDPDFDGEPYLKITTGNIGEVDHSFDFGFRPYNCSVTIDTFFTQNCSGTGITQTGDLIFIVSWTDAPSGEDINVTLDGGSAQTIPVSTTGTSPDTVTFSGLNANYGIDYQAIATFATTTTCADTTDVFLNCSQICSENLNSYVMDWSNIGWVNPTGSGQFPNYTQVFNDIDGSGISMTVIVHEEPQTSSGYQMANPGCNPGRCDFDTELTTYLPSGEVMRHFRMNNSTIDSISISFSEPILLDTFLFGGNRPPSDGNFGVSQLTFYDGPNKTGNKVGPNQRTYADITKVDTITVEGPLSTTAPMNILEGTTTNGNIIGKQTMAYADGSFFSFGEERPATRRPWGVLNMDSVYIQSLTWSIFASSSNDPATTRANAINSGNLSAYISNFRFQKCESSVCDTISQLITDRVLCEGENVDTLAALTTFENPDSIAFVYFTSVQTDSSVIYATGNGIDTIQISVGNDTARITDVSVPAFVPDGVNPDTFYVYAIAHPTPSDNTCRPYEEILVIVNPIPTISISNVEVCAGSSTTVSATAAGGTGALKYLWTVPSGESDPGNVSSFSASTAGTYSVTVTDTKTCSANASGTLTVNPNPTVSVANAEVCDGSSATISATAAGGTGALTYAWTVPSGESDPGNMASFSASTAGTYSVTVTDTKTCSANASGTLTVNPNPTVSVANAEVCDGSSATISATAAGGTGALTYAWTVPSGESDPGNVASFSASTAGTYSVTVTDTKTCSANASGTLTVNPNPTVSVANAEVCDGSSTTISATAAGGTGALAYAWTVPSGESDPGNVASFSASTAGTYSVTITDTKTCSANASGTLTVNANPTCNIFGNTSITPNTQDEIFTGVGGMTAYEWSIISGDATIDGVSNMQNVTIDFGTAASTIQLIVTNGDGCKDTCTISSIAGDFDLALKKDLAVNQSDTIGLGDDVDYTITVINEGDITATNIQVCDLIPDGMILSPIDMNSWDDTNSDTVYQTIVGPLVAGDSAVLNIKLRVVYGGAGTSLTNIAEITEAQDESGATILDIDSTPANGTPGEDDIEDETVQLLNHDPTGWVYCDKTGKIITGGTISVTGPNGIPNNEVNIIHDGSNGYFEFYATGLAGIYTITYSHPDGVTLSTSKLPITPALDPTGMSSPVVMGVDTLIGGMYISDTSFVSNPYYLAFDLELGDPPILLNNLPVRCVFIGGAVCFDNDGNGIDDGNEPGLPGATVYLYDCSDQTTRIDSTISDANGHFNFDGLIAGNYVLQFETPDGYKIIASQVDTLTNGFTSCMNLDWNDCDTSKVVCFSQIFDLALKKEVLTPAPYQGGDDVTFEITVYNQGTADASNIEVLDYIPAGLVLNDSNWDEVSSQVAADTITSLVAGDSVSLFLTLRIHSAFSGTLINNAEIVAADGGIDEDDPLTNTNDGSTNELGNDNNVNDDGINTPGTTDLPADEDDYDPALIEVDCPDPKCLPVQVTKGSN